MTEYLYVLFGIVLTALAVVVLLGCAVVINEALKALRK